MTGVHDRDVRLPATGATPPRAGDGEAECERPGRDLSWVTAQEAESLGGEAGQNAVRAAAGFDGRTRAPPAAAHRETLSDRTSLSRRSESMLRSGVKVEAERMLRP